MGSVATHFWVLSGLSGALSIIFPTLNCCCPLEFILQFWGTQTQHIWHLAGLELYYFLYNNRTESQNHYCLSLYLLLLLFNHLTYPEREQWIRYSFVQLEFLECNSQIITSFLLQCDTCSMQSGQGQLNSVRQTVLSLAPKVADVLTLETHAPVL